MTRITLLSAIAPFDDPWHDFETTTDQIAELLGEYDVTVDRVGSLAELPDSLRSADLFIANCSADQYLDAPAFDDFADALDSFVARGGSVLSMHASLLAFQGVPRWAELLGCRWNHPISMHPQKGWALVQVTGSTSPIVADLTPFSIYDERYAKLDLFPGSEEMLFHTMEGQTHPLLWQRQLGASRIVVDALGHGIESFDNEEHRTIIRRSLDWLLEPVPATVS